MDRRDCSCGARGLDTPHLEQIPKWNWESDPSIATGLEGIQSLPGSAKRKLQSYHLGVHALKWPSEVPFRSSFCAGLEPATEAPLISSTF